jgi:hypothetical protein
MTNVLEERLARTANALDDSDWRDVERRARRPRRRLAVAAVLAATLAILVIPPFSVGGRLLDLIEGKPAPRAVQSYFAADNALRQRLLAYERTAGHELDHRYSDVVPTEARGVAAIESPDGPIYLWAAPTQDGRQCWLIQAGADPTTSRPYGFGSCDDASPASPLLWERYWTQERPTVQIVHARVYDNSITRVVFDADGSQPLSLRVVSGHALGTVPLNTRITAVRGVTADGHVRASRIR